jgi:hypothetical protein
MTVPQGGVHFRRKEKKMTLNEFEEFLEKHGTVEWYENEERGVFGFWDKTYPFYANGGITEITYQKMDEMDGEKLAHAIYDGVRVENITRVTGYFAKVNSWNSGKKAELKDRYKGAI